MKLIFTKGTGDVFLLEHFFLFFPAVTCDLARSELQGRDHFVVNITRVGSDVQSGRRRWMQLQWLVGVCGRRIEYDGGDGREDSIDFLEDI